MQRKKEADILTESLVMLVAFTLDCIGEPPARWHPVVWYGKLISSLDRIAPAGRLRQFLYGIFMPVLATVFVLPVMLSISSIARRLRQLAQRRGMPIIGNSFYALLMGAALKPFFALRMLVDAGRMVRLPLEQKDLDAARQALQSLVSRDRSQLSEELAAAAAIESLAENLSDSVVAPLFYYSVLGLPGVALYRLYNTFDSMIGYRGRYEYLGKASARLDDALNLFPSRLTALLIIGLAPFYGGDTKRAWRIWRRDAHKTASPNAGHPMAAAAGALGIQLEKVDHYALGDREQAVVPHDIKRAERMVWLVGGCAVALGILYTAMRSRRRA